MNRIFKIYIIISAYYFQYLTVLRISLVQWLQKTLLKKVK